MSDELQITVPYREYLTLRENYGCMKGVLCSVMLSDDCSEPLRKRIAEALKEVEKKERNIKP